MGEDPASAVYVGGKQRACAEVGIEGFDHRLPVDASQAEVVVAAYFDRLVRALVVQRRGSGAGVLCLPCLV